MKQQFTTLDTGIICHIKKKGRTDVVEINALMPDAFENPINKQFSNLQSILKNLGILWNR